jgi:hypothetical protein
MILVHEPTWTGTLHAPGNSATVQALARALPGVPIRILAEASHLAELRADPALAALPGIATEAVALSPRFRFRPHIVSARRLWTEWRTLARALAGVPVPAPCLIFLISTTATSLAAAAWLARRRRAPTAVLVGWHGNLNEAMGWRPRNPLARALDLRAGLEAATPRLCHLVLEEGIRDALIARIPAAAARTAVLELPINLAEAPPGDALPLAPPIHVGLVGQATAAKGAEAFLAAARAAKARFGEAVAFHLVGRLPPGEDPAPWAAILAHAPESEHLPRARFTARLAGLHYVFLPLDPAYYALSASGALIDAITFTKPVIATRVPIVAGLFRAHGDIGFMADEPARMTDVLLDVLAHPDPARYAAQVTALKAARAAREPAALAARFRAIVAGVLPELVNDSNPLEAP